MINIWVMNSLKNQAMKLKKEERPREKQVEIIRYLVPLYEGLDLLLEDEKDSFNMMDRIYEKVRTR